MEKYNKSNPSSEDIRQIASGARSAIEIGKLKGNQADYMQVVEDSQGYSALEQIKESLRILQIGYEVRPVPEEGIHINWPPISIEYMIKGIENSIQQGYELINTKDNR